LKQYLFSIFLIIREQKRRDVHQITSSILSISEKIDSNQDLSSDLNELSSLCSNDEFLSNVLKSSMIDFASNPMVSSFSSKPTSFPPSLSIPTLDDLRMRFEIVKKEARKASLAPKSSNGMVGQALGSLFSILTIAPKGFLFERIFGLIVFFLYYFGM